MAPGTRRLASSQRFADRLLDAFGQVLPIRRVFKFSGLYVLRKGYSALVLLVGVLLGTQLSSDGAQSPFEQPQGFAAEIAALKQQVLISQLNHPAATERLRGVRYGLEFSQLYTPARLTLERVVRSDQNTHVRLAAVQVLYRFIDDPAVQSALARLCLEQDNPAVQLLMVSQMQQWNPELGSELARKLGQSETTSPKVKQYVSELN